MCYQYIAILQLGAAQQCSCTTGIAVIAQDHLKKEIRTELSAALAENGVANITNSILALNATIRRAMEKISTEIGQLVAPLLAQLKHLQLPGKTPSHPATICKEIQELKPSTPSGYYWITASDDSAVRMYCDMSRTCGGITGGWMRVTSINMTNSSHQCPNGLKTITKVSKRLCVKKLDGAGCSSIMFQVHGIKYTHVCGKVIRYQDKSTDAFSTRERHIDGTPAHHTVEENVPAQIIKSHHHCCHQLTQAVEPLSAAYSIQMIPSGMARDVGPAVPAAPSTLLRGSLKLFPPLLATILS